jgi:YHS domain-containing protein
MFKKVVVFLILFVFIVGVSYVIASEIKKVEPSYVCMVNNAEMGRPQIPIKVGDVTYYGCCMGCVGSIQGNKIDPSTGLSVRYSIDPVSKHQVDKANAVIGAMPDGRVLYFESEKTFAEFSKK